MSLQTPDDIIIKQVPVSSPMKTGIFSLNHNLPEVVRWVPPPRVARGHLWPQDCPFNLYPAFSSLGTWTITAKFEDSPEQVFSTQFEVKEYGKVGWGSPGTRVPCACPGCLGPLGVHPTVLPSFEVVVEPEEKFLYIDQKEDFRVSITARCDGDPKTAHFGGQTPLGDGVG